MKNKKSKLARRITWRVSMIMLFVNILVMAFVLLFVIVVSEDQSNTRSQYITDGISMNLKTMIDLVETAAVNNVAEVERSIDDPEKVYQVLEDILKLNPYYCGCFAAFEPDYFPDKGRWFEPYVKIIDSAKVQRQQIGGVDHDYLQYEWYKKGIALKKTDRGYLSDMYFDEDGAKAPISSFILPIHDKTGRVVGVYGIDLMHNWLASTLAKEEEKALDRVGLHRNLNEIDGDKYIYCMVVDGKGQFIAGSNSLDKTTLNEILAKDSTDFYKVDIDDTSSFISSKRIAPTDWTLIVVQEWFMVYFMGLVLGFIILFFMILGHILIYFSTWNSIRRVIKPLHYLNDSAKEVAKGNFDTELPTFKRNDEISQLRNSFETMQLSLKQYIKELKETTASKATMESELNIAHRIQMSMLPKMNPPFPGRNDIDLFGSLKPAKAVGGDLYDFFVNDEKLFFCIGDVSGKGVPASLVMAVTRTLFRNIASHLHEPKNILKAMNDTVSESNETCMFVTVFVGMLDLKSGLLRYCNGGHDEPYIGHNLLSCIPNLPIGTVPDMEFQEQETIVPFGTTIFLYTDGLTEAENCDHVLFGDDRVAQIISSIPESEATPHRLIEEMTSAVNQFVGATEQSDDLTMLAIRIKK